MAIFRGSPARIISMYGISVCMVGNRKFRPVAPHLRSFEIISVCVMDIASRCLDRP